MVDAWLRPDSMMTCASGRDAFSARSVAIPSRPGIMTSSSTTSGASLCFTDASSSSPRVWKRASYPRRERKVRRYCANPVSSSTIATYGFLIVYGLYADSWECPLRFPHAIQDSYLDRTNVSWGDGALMTQELAQPLDGRKKDPRAGLTPGRRAPESPAVRLDEPARDRKAQPDAAAPLVENRTLVVGVERRVCFLVADPQLDRARAVERRVAFADRQSIGRHELAPERRDDGSDGLRQPERIAVDERGAVAELDLDGDVAVGQRRQPVDGRPNGGAQIGPLSVEGEGAGFQVRQLADFQHQRRQPLE